MRRDDLIFGALQRALGRKPNLHDPREILFFAFDLPYLDGHDLRRVIRFASADGCSSRSSPAREGVTRLSEEVEGDGNELYLRAWS